MEDWLKCQISRFVKHCQNHNNGSIIILWSQRSLAVVAGMKKTEWPRRTDKSWTLKKNTKRTLHHWPRNLQSTTGIYMFAFFYFCLMPTIWMSFTLSRCKKCRLSSISVVSFEAQTLILLITYQSTTSHLSLRHFAAAFIDNALYIM